jgi:vitamin B12 transporter
MNTPMKSLLNLMTAVLLCVLWTGAAYGQSTASLRGLVADATGGAVKDARVVLLYSGKLSMRETTTGATGLFVFDRLKPGNYSIAVEALGLTQSGGAQPVKLDAGRSYQIIIPLTVAAIQEAVIISASRTDSPAAESATSAFIATSKDLMLAQRVNVFDALRSSPGVAIAQSGRRGALSSMFVRGGESDYTKVLIDGVPVNDAGGAFDLADLTTDNVSRVELVRGAQSAIYGSDAMSGVLQLFTHRGSTSTPEFVFEGEGGSFAFNRQYARMSGANRGFDYSTSYTHLRTDGRDRNDDYQNRVVTANVGYRASSRTQIRTTLRYDNAGLGVPGATAFLFPDPDERAKRKHIATSGRIDDQTTKYWHQSLSFVYSESKTLGFDPVAQDLSQPTTPVDQGLAFNDFSNYFNNRQRRRGLRYQSDLVLPNAHFISAGVDFDQERAVFDSGFDATSRIAAERRNIGAFIQDQFAYGPRLFITAGVRIENNRADMPAAFTELLRNQGLAPYSGNVGFGTEVVPKISGIYVLRASGIQSRRGATRLKANWGRGIKAPSMLEAFSPNPLFLGNPLLKPERALNFDVGVEQLFWRDRVRLEGVYFENRFRNQIAVIGDPSNFGGPVTMPDGHRTNFINNDRTHTRGYEISTAFHPNRRLQFGGNYTFLVTELEAAADVIDFNTGTLIRNPEIGLPLLRRPRHSGSVNMAYLGKKFDFNLDAFLVGRRRDLDPVLFTRFDAAGNVIYNKGYQRIDLAGAYRLSRFMTIFARIENLLNRNYQEVLGYPAYQLNFSGGMRFRFGGGK